MNGRPTRIPSALEDGLVEPAVEARFSAAEVADQPEPVRRHLEGAIPAGAPLVRSARLRMRGRIRVGRWLPFRAEEVLHPQRGFVWTARAAGLISGYDRYVSGEGEAHWALAGLVTVMHMAGPDVSRSAAERGAAEGIWLPTSLLPRFGVAWAALDDEHVEASYEIDGRPVRVTSRIDGSGRLRWSRLQRWGDPDGTGAWAAHPFGVEVEETGDVGGLVVPVAGRVGWFHGTDRWTEGEFFRYRITRLQPLGLAAGT